MFKKLLHTVGMLGEVSYNVEFFESTNVSGTHRFSAEVIIPGGRLVFDDDSIEGLHAMLSTQLAISIRAHGLPTSRLPDKDK